MTLPTIFILVVSLVTFCNGLQSNTGANTFLKSKWKTWFEAVDVNHDGVLSMDDLEKSRSKFSELHHSYEYKILDKWWNECIFKGKSGEVTESEFVNALDKDFTTGKKKFKTQMVKCFTLDFDVIDTNKDKSISEKELHIVLKAYGHANDVMDTKYFEAYKPVDGLVPLSNFVDSWVDFVTSEDAAKGSIVETFFEGGV